MAACSSSKRLRCDHEIYEPRIKRSRGVSKHVNNDYVHDTNLKKRGPVCIFPHNRPDISSKKTRLIMSHSVIRSSEIKERFAYFMPYGCRYNTERRIISFFNEYYDFIGTKDRFNIDLFEASNTRILYDKCLHPTEDVSYMKRYIESLVEFMSYTEIVPDQERPSGYATTDNLHHLKANRYRTLIFGSQSPLRRIDHHVY